MRPRRRVPPGSMSPPRDPGRLPRHRPRQRRAARGTSPPSRAGAALRLRHARPSLPASRSCCPVVYPSQGSQGSLALWGRTADGVRYERVHREAISGRTHEAWRERRLRRDRAGRTEAAPVAWRRRQPRGGARRGGKHRAETARDSPLQTMPWRCGFSSPQRLVGLHRPAKSQVTHSQAHSPIPPAPPKPTPPSHFLHQRSHQGASENRTCRGERGTHTAGGEQGPHIA